MAGKSPRRRVVFCDFDGTITVEETFVGMARRYARLGHDEVAALVELGLLTQGEAVRRLVGSIPPSSLRGMRSYIRARRLRPGFSGLLAFLSAHGVPLVVVSGGLREQAEARLARYGRSIHAVHGAHTAVRDGRLAVSSDFEGHGELVCKHRVMERYPCDEAVVIGNGESDLSMAVTADVVFARDELCGLLDARGLPYVGWETFDDVRKALRLRWFGASASKGSALPEAGPSAAPESLEVTG